MLELLVSGHGGCVISVSSQKYQCILVSGCLLVRVKWVSATLPVLEVKYSQFIWKDVEERIPFPWIWIKEMILGVCKVENFRLWGMLRVVGPEAVRWVKPWQRACSRGTSTNWCTRASGVASGGWCWRVNMGRARRSGVSSGLPEHSRIMMIISYI